MQAIFREFRGKEIQWAVVGVSSDPSKYGFKVFFDLQNAGWKVFAVHPQGGEVEGSPRYKSVKECPSIPDVAVYILPPAVTEKVVSEAAQIGVKWVWMQPGASNDAVIAVCENLGLKCVHDKCVMVERQKFGY